MGIFDGWNRFREQGQAPDSRNVRDFGVPARSLFTSSKIFSLRGEIDVMDNDGHVVYRAESKPLSLVNETYLFNAEGRKVATMKQKIFSIHERHFVEMENGTKFQLSNELFHIIKDITNIEEFGWQLQGDIMELNFHLYDQNGKIIANFDQKSLSLHDKYCADIYQVEYEEIVVAILITLIHMIKHREAERAAASSY